MVSQLAEEFLRVLGGDGKAGELGDANERKDECGVLADWVAEQVADAALDAAPFLDEPAEGGPGDRVGHPVAEL